MFAGEHWDRPAAFEIGIWTLATLELSGPITATTFGFETSAVMFCAPVCGSWTPSFASSRTTEFGMSMVQPPAVPPASFTASLMPLMIGSEAALSLPCWGSSIPKLTVPGAAPAGAGVLGVSAALLAPALAPALAAGLLPPPPVLAAGTLPPRSAPGEREHGDGRERADLAEFHALSSSSLIDREAPDDLGRRFRYPVRTGSRPRIRCPWSLPGDPAS